MAHVEYMNRIRDYYLSQGYEKSYVWSHYEEVPFVPLKKPLSECQVTLFSTSDVSIKSAADEGPSEAETTVGNVYSIPWDTPLDKLYSRQESFDRYATSLDDINSYLPLTRLDEFAAEGRFAGRTANFHNINRGYSQRMMLEQAAPAALRKCRDEAADVVILTPV
ncbi:MAG TPA: hypothetical protein QGF63_08055 [Alphaproteobacteria bacterium]|nr:hypothetical protein [Alphaproteobacteria bacterium]